jgi:hypothetical protein
MNSVKTQFLAIFLALVPLVAQANPATPQEESSFAKSALADLAKSEGLRLDESSIKFSSTGISTEKVLNFLFSPEFDKKDLSEKSVTFSVTDNAGRTFSKRALLVSNRLEQFVSCPVNNNTTRTVQSAPDKNLCFGIAYGAPYDGVTENILISRLPGSDEPDSKVRSYNTTAGSIRLDMIENYLSAQLNANVKVQASFSWGEYLAKSYDYATIVLDIQADDKAIASCNFVLPKFNRRHNPPAYEDVSASLGNCSGAKAQNVNNIRIPVKETGLE